MDESSNEMDDVSMAEKDEDFEAPFMDEESCKSEEEESAPEEEKDNDNEEGIQQDAEVSQFEDEDSSTSDEEDDIVNMPSTDSYGFPKASPNDEFTHQMMDDEDESSVLEAVVVDDDDEDDDIGEVLEATIVDDVVSSSDASEKEAREDASVPLDDDEDDGGCMNAVTDTQLENVDEGREIPVLCDSELSVNQENSIALDGDEAKHELGSDEETSKFEEPQPEMENVLMTSAAEHNGKEDIEDVTSVVSNQEIMESSDLKVNSLKLSPRHSQSAEKKSEEGEQVEVTASSLKNLAIDDTMKTPDPKKKAKTKTKRYHRHEGIVKRDKWTLGAKIGVGSFGVVHVGMNTLTGTLMAVKTFKLERAVMKDIQQEVTLMRKLKHTNIVAYYGAQMDKAKLHIFQEWVPAGSVSTMLSKFGAFHLPVIQNYLAQTIEGLAYLHDQHILHRDIKGSNILVNDAGVVKLADFGASKQLQSLQSDLMMTMSVRGTPYFMAPEVFEEKYSSKADIWGIGCVAIQMATGSPPWRDKGFSNPISLFNHIKKQTGSYPMNLDNENESPKEKDARLLFENFVACCYQLDPSKRPTAHGLKEDPFLSQLKFEYESQTPCRGLFSPSSTISGTPSPIAKSSNQNTPPPPSSEKSSKVRSVVQWKTSFKSPPKSKGKSNKTRGSPSPLKMLRSGASPLRGGVSPFHSRLINAGKSPYRASPLRERGAAAAASPGHDTSEWPSWASRHMALKQQQSNPDALTDLMGSLALSEDTGVSNPYRRSSSSGTATTGGVDKTVDVSTLDGLKFVDQSDITYDL